MKRFMPVIILLTFLGSPVLTGPAIAEPIKCEQCSKDVPCVTVLEFKDVKFAHEIYCSIDDQGTERWDSDDESTLQLFYRYGNSGQESENPKLDI